MLTGSAKLHVLTPHQFLLSWIRVRFMLRTFSLHSLDTDSALCTSKIQKQSWFVQQHRFNLLWKTGLILVLRSWWAHCVSSNLRRWEVLWRTWWKFRSWVLPKWFGIRKPLLLWSLWLYWFRDRNLWAIPSGSKCHQYPNKLYQTKNKVRFWAH